ncbi:MAG: hypothetical protein ACRCZF_18665 [Gemmataceae bacterium]
MLPSGAWRGFWEQDYFGRQTMEEFQLYFRDEGVEGGGVDVIGRFTFRGTYDVKTGHVELTKQYLGRHRVEYVGQPDGEGSILGRWRIKMPGVDASGPFVMQPVWHRPSGEEHIEELR